MAYGLMLPAIAVLHVRHRTVRESGAVLGTIAGTSAVVVGLGAAVDPALAPAALVVLGVWWWTVGKMWAETAVIARPLGLLTAALGAIALGAAVAPPLALGGGVADLRAVHGVLAAWLALLALALLASTRDVPSR